MANPDDPKTGAIQPMLNQHETPEHQMEYNGAKPKKTKQLGHFHRGEIKGLMCVPDRKGGLWVCQDDNFKEPHAYLGTPIKDKNKKAWSPPRTSPHDKDEWTKCVGKKFGNSHRAQKQGLETTQRGECSETAPGYGSVSTETAEQPTRLDEPPKPVKRRYTASSPMEHTDWYSQEPEKSKQPSNPDNRKQPKGHAWKEDIFYDSHFHLDRMNNNRKLPKHSWKGITAIGGTTCFCDPDTFPSIQELKNIKENMPRLKVCLGIHPKYSKKYHGGRFEKEKGIMREAIEKGLIAGIGEIGMDIHGGSEIEQINLMKDIIKLPHPKLLL